MLKESAQNLIVTADDFGISSLANQNILELLRAGRLHRIAVMVDGALSPEEIAILKNSLVKLDLHLETPGLINKTQRKLSAGVIGRIVYFLKLYFSGQLKKEKIAAVWDAQCQKFFALFGRYPDGLNAHEHLHYFPVYFRIVLVLAQKYHCAYLRFGKKGLTPSFLPVRNILWILRKINARRFFCSRLDSSDWVMSFDWQKNSSLRNKYLARGTVELIFHPEREEEKQALLSE